MERKRQGTDIIIPVFNGYEDVIACMESIAAHTNLKTNGVIFVNDASTDEKIMPLLSIYAEKYGTTISVIDSRKNQGFSASVNIGMKATDRDVLLLNSDTIVTEGWLDRMRTCAYSDASIATVTPFSNCATLCSLPEFCKDNPMPEGIDVDTMGHIVEECSIRRFPAISVAVGFCMYIKRVIIEQIGYFDEVSFEKGYGEENDFCNRAEQIGYRQVLCDNVFVYHRGTGSFDSEEKKRLCADHDAILRERYPKLMEQNDLYCQKDPNRDLRENVNLYTALHNGRKNLLYVLHEDFRMDTDNYQGGTQFHVRDLVEGMVDTTNVFVLVRLGDYLRLSVYISAMTPAFTLRFYVGKRSIFPTHYNKQVEQVMEAVLNNFRIQMVHIHHVDGIGLEPFYVASKIGIPLIVTLHDYYYLCPNFKLLCGNERCQVYKEGGREQCAKCLHDTIGATVDNSYVKMYQEKMRKALALCKEIIVPSQTAKKVYVDAYKELESKIQVIPHGSRVGTNRIEIGHNEIQIAGAIRSNIDCMFDDPFRLDAVTGWCYLEGCNQGDIKIVIEIVEPSGMVKYYQAGKMPRPDVVHAAGGNEEYKYCGFSANIFRRDLEEGSLTIRILLQKDGIILTNNLTYAYTNKRNMNPVSQKELRIAVLGGMVIPKGAKLTYDLIKKNIPNVKWYTFGTDFYEPLIHLTAENYIKVGSYQAELIAYFLKYHKIDVVCILSLWDETFSYTLSEAWLAGIPVLALNTGAVAERICKTGCGWIVNADELETKIKELRDNKESVRKVAERIREHSDLRSVEDMLADYKILYEKAAAHVIHHVVYQKQILKAYISGNPNLCGVPVLAGENMDREDDLLYKTERELRIHLEQMMDEKEEEVKKAYREAERLEQELAWVYGSKSYKLSHQIAKASHSFRKEK